MAEHAAKTDIATVARSDAGGVSSLVICAPATRNALSLDLAEELLGVLRGADADPNIRVITITGAGDTFCAGGDIRDLEESATGADAQRADTCWRALFSIHSWCNTPVIAIVNGAAMGAGCALAVACHFAFATEAARFALPELRLSIFPTMGLPGLIARIGPARATELALSARVVGAGEAAQTGLVVAVCDPDEINARVQAIADRVSVLSPQSLADGLSLIDRLSRADPGARLRIAAERRTRSISTPEARAALQKALAGRRAKAS